MRKKLVTSLSIFLCSAALVGSILVIHSNSNAFGNAKATNEIRSITIDTKTNVLTDSEEFVESTATLKTDQLKNNVGFKFKAKLNADGNSYNLGAGNDEKAYVMNVASSPIGKIQTIEINKMSGDYNSYLIEYGWDLDGGGNIIYENSVFSYLETDLGPSYFRVRMDYDYGYDSMIESIVITYSVDCETPAENPYVTKDGIKYQVYSDHAEVAGLADLSIKDVTIASLVSGKPVTAIGEKAFSNKAIETVVLNASITAIRNRAFYRCNLLQSVIGCGGVISIGSSAFEECRIMTTIPFEGDVIETIGDRAFQSCNAMQSELIFDVQVTSIGNSAFRYCNSIETVRFDDDCELTAFSKGFESDMGGLKTFHIGENMTDPYGITQSWYTDTALETVTIGTSGTENATYKVIDNAVYRKLENGKLKLLIIFTGAEHSYVAPNNVTELNNYICYSNNVITNVDLRNFDATIIPYCSFSYCSNLSTVKLGKVTKIEGYVFQGCTSLTAIDFEGTTDEWKSVTLADHWAESSAIAVIHCTDGDVELN